MRSGAAKPDISSVEALKRTLRGAKSLAYLKAGISGPYSDSLFETWEIPTSFSQNPSELKLIQWVSLLRREMQKLV